MNSDESRQLWLQRRRDWKLNRLKRELARAHTAPATGGSVDFRVLPRWGIDDPALPQAPPEPQRR